MSTKNSFFFVVKNSKATNEIDKLTAGSQAVFRYTVKTNNFNCSPRMKEKSSNVIKLLEYWKKISEVAVTVMQNNCYASEQATLPPKHKSFLAAERMCDTFYSRPDSGNLFH